MFVTSNVGFGRVEKILEAFEVERFIKKLVETQTFGPLEIKALASRLFYHSGFKSFISTLVKGKNIFSTKEEKHIYDCGRTQIFLSGSADEF